MIKKEGLTMDSNSFVLYSDLCHYLNLPWDTPGLAVYWNGEDERIIPVTPEVIRLLNRHGMLVECFLTPHLLGRDLTREEFVTYTALHSVAVKQAMQAWKQVGLRKHCRTGSAQFLYTYRYDAAEAVIATLWPMGA